MKDRKHTTIRLDESLFDAVISAQRKTDLNQTQAIAKIIKFGLPVFVEWVKREYPESEDLPASFRPKAHRPTSHWKVGAP